MTPGSSAQPSHKFPWTKSYPVDISWNTEIPESTMVNIFEDAVRKHQNRTCLNFMGKHLTYKEVGQMVDRFAKGLQDQGIGKGSKIGLCLPNSPFYVIAYYGALKAGATVVNFNPLYAEKEIEHQIKDSETDIMVTLNMKQMLPKVQKNLNQGSLKKIIVCDIADALPWHKGTAYSALTTVKRWLGKGDAVKAPKDGNHLSFKKMLKSKGAFKPVDVKPEDLAVLQYTGGTTGVPKAAMLSHNNIATNTQQAALWFSSMGAKGKQERILAVLPFFHVFSMTGQMNLGVHTGSELVLLPKFELKNLLETITKEKPTMFAAVPTIYKAITDCKSVNKYDLSSLTICVSGGAALNEETMKAFKKLTGVELVEGYGLSETSPLVSINPVGGAKKLNSIGIPVPKTEIRISDLQFPDKDVPIKMEGEICLRGPQVMQGYWKRPDETALVIDKDKWLHTGDVGYMDDDGYVFIVDRIKDMVIVNGMKAFPRKIEDAIMKHEAVSEVIVIGVKDDLRGEIVKAFIVLKEGKTLEQAELKKFLESQLAPYEMPKQVEYRTSLPKTMIGKPDKKALKAEEAAKQKVAPPKPPKAA